MKFGLRTPSLKKRISAKTSVKRYVRHSMGLKMPKGTGIFTNPKKAVYNKVYNKTTFGIGDVTRTNSNKRPSSSSEDSQTYLPVSNNDPYRFSPQSFIGLIKSSDKFGQDGWAKTIIIFGIILLFGNPILGIVLLAVGSYWMYKIKDKNWYKVKSLVRKAKKSLRAERFEEALTPLREANILEPDNISIQYMLGVVQHVIGKYEDSISQLTSYVNSAPHDLDAKLVLAYSYYKNDQFKEAVPLLQQFPQEHPNYLLVILLLGDSFIQIKEFDMAVEVLKRGPTRKTKLDPYLLQLHYLLGVAYKGKGAKSSALKEFNRVYAFDVSYKDVEKNLKELELN